MTAAIRRTVVSSLSLCAIALAPSAWAEPTVDAAPKAPEAEVAPGTLLVVADADGTAILASGTDEQQVTLKKGENRFPMAAGRVVVIRVDPGAVSAKPAEIAIESAKESRIDLTTRGRVIAALPAADASLEVDGKPVAVKDGKAVTEVLAGTHSVVVRQPGYYGNKSAFRVSPGLTTELTAQMEQFEGNGHRGLAWTGILGGGALVVAAIAIDAASKFDKVGGDSVRWGMLTVGSLGFVGGTILLKSIIDDEASPPVRDGRIDIKVSAAHGGAAAQVAGTF